MGKEEDKMETSNALKFNSYDDLFGDMFNKEEQNKQPEQVVITKQEEQSLVDNNIENISNVNVGTAVAKLKSIESELNNEFVEREELINIMILSLVTNSNLLMLGDPGTAKSKISMALCDRIDNSRFFQWLLNKSSDPAELLGTFSIKGMENDEFRRVTDGKLPEANIAFIDEIYKCNSPTLNALLSIMNEHIFYNDGKIVNVPLISMFAASNEPPEDDSLLAMHDRFLFRIRVNYVHDAANKKRMFNNYVYERAGIDLNPSRTMISIEELECLQEQAKKVSVPKAIINKFISLLSTLSKNDTISVSDRRANECLKILQGSAVINGRTKVALSDFNALKYVLWEKEQDIDTIVAEINKIVNPFDEEFAKFNRQFNEVKEKIRNASDVKERNQLYFQYQNSIKGLLSKMNKLITEANTNGKDTYEYCKVRDEIHNYYTNLTTDVLGNTLGSNPFGTETATVEATDETNSVDIVDTDSSDEESSDDEDDI